MKYLLLPFLTLLMGLVVLTGCANSGQKLSYNVVAPNKLETFKRESHHGDFHYLIHRINRRAYDEVSSTQVLRRLTADKEEVLERHGQPDFLREGFRAMMTEEIVDEWIYWERMVVVQFVGGNLVYEGPMTEMDSFRVRFGYPDSIFRQPGQDLVGLKDNRIQTLKPGEGTKGQGVNRQVWVYSGSFLGAEGKILTFSGEELVSFQTN